jgi:chloramphenicol-sensitive protein RarD
LYRHFSANDAITEERVKREEGSSATGVLFALGAYGLWGVSPVYWKWVSELPLLELLAWRVLWSFALVVAFGAVTHRGEEARAALRAPRVMAPLLCTALLLGVNWLTFVYAVQTERVVATSLGYYMSPLVNVLLGMLVLGERLPRAQGFALGLATAGVAYMTYEYGELPWIALVLPTTFGVYGLIRKLVRVRPLVGLGLEMLLLLPVSLGYLAWLLASGRSAVAGQDLATHALVAGAGLVTALPLVWFVNAARRLPLTTIGMFQYVAPSVTLLIAVWFFGEPFTRAQAITFGCVWIALAIYTREFLQQAVRVSRRRTG